MTVATGHPYTGTGAHRSTDTPLRRGAAAVAVTGGAFSLVAAASPASVTVPVVPVAQISPAASHAAPAATDAVVLRPSVEPVDPDPEIVDATDLVKAVQLAEQAVERIAAEAAERAAAEERAAQARAAQERAQAEARLRPVVSVGPVSVGGGGDCDIDTSGLGRVKSHVRSAAEFLGCQYGEPDMHGVAGRAGTSDHPSGLAVDFMVSRATGDALADCALENMDALGIKYVIWEQRINHGNGWKPMEDRGGATANHFDHVHISFDSGRGSGDLKGC